MVWVAVVLGAVAGAVLVLLLQLGLVVWFARGTPPTDPVLDPASPADCTLPEEGSGDAGESSEEALSALLQFVFQQVRHEPRTRRWLRRKLAVELAELLARTAPTRLFDSLTLRDMDLGSEFVHIGRVRLDSSSKEGASSCRLRCVTLRLDVTYSGGCRIDVDAVMLLGKVANLSITVERLSGTVLVRMTRAPYTHWSLAFARAPELALRVHGHFQGRPLRPKLAHLISAQIKRAIARRHTMPNYKIRYKPFFTKTDPGQPDTYYDDVDPIKPHGTLKVLLVECTRLHSESSYCNIHCTVAVDSYPWVSLKTDKEGTTIITLDLVITKTDSEPLGVVFKQTVGSTGEKNVKVSTYVIVETVVPLSAAYSCDLRRGDIIIAVDNKRVSNMSQVAKIIKGIRQRTFTVRVERKTKTEISISGVPNDVSKETGAGDKNLLDPKRPKSNSFSFRRVSEVMEGVRLQGLRSKSDTQADSDSPSCVKTQPEKPQESEAKKNKSTEQFVAAKQIINPSPNKVNEPIQIPFVSFGLRKRRCSVENKPSSDSSTSSTPPASGASSPLKNSRNVSADKARQDSAEDLDPINAEPDETCSAKSEKLEKSGGSRPLEILQMHGSKTMLLETIVTFNDNMEFTLNENHKYLNVNVWGKPVGTDGDCLLGFLNIPLNSVLAECHQTPLASHLKQYTLLPPDVNITFSKSHQLSSHSGFEPCLCFGDVLVSYAWRGRGADERPTNREADEERAAPELAPTPLDRPHAQHDFVRTHFHRSTQCDFCNKKIWLKDAVQCRECALCCHKKCIAKCQSGSPCVAAHDPQNRSGGSSPSRVEPPEFLMTEHYGAGAPEFDIPDSDEERGRKGSLDTSRDEAVSGSGGLGQNMSALLAGLRRAGSAHSLALPTRRGNPDAWSLPPSPSHTPRKQSLCGCPFAEVGALWQSGGVSAALRPLLASAEPPDALLAAARDRGPALLAQLPPDERAATVNQMMSSVREALSSDDASVSEERARALTALMLHCCAAAQHAAAANTAANSAANSAANHAANSAASTAATIATTSATPEVTTVAPEIPTNQNTTDSTNSMFAQSETE